MKARTLVTVILLIVFLMESLAIVNLAKANPIPWNTTPNLDPPTIVVETPQNNSVYNASSSIYIKFNVTEPDSWYKYYMGFIPYVGQITSVKAYLDDLEINIQYIGVFSATINPQSSGLHILNVTVLSYTYYKGPPYNNTHIVHLNSSSGDPTIYQYPIVVSKIVYFTTDGEQSAFLTPTPSSNMQMPTATPVLPPEDRNAPHLDPVYYLIPASVVGAIVVLSVLALKRHQKAANLNK